MLEDTAAAIVITSKESRSKLQASAGVEIIELHSDWSTAICQLSTVNSQLSTPIILLMSFILPALQVGPRG